MFKFNNYQWLKRLSHNRPFCHVTSSKSYYFLSSLCLILCFVFGIVNEFHWAYIVVGELLILLVVFFERRDQASSLLSKITGGLKKYKLRSAILFFMCILGVVWRVDAVLITFVIIFLSFLFYAWDTRVLFAAFIACLVVSLLFLIFNNKNLANISAVYSYYLLLLAVILQLWRYWQDDRSNGRHLIADSAELSRKTKTPPKRRRVVKLKDKKNSVI